MAVQSRTDVTSKPFILDGTPYSREAETIEQDAGRVAALAPYTTMAFDPSVNKWVPLTDTDPALTAGKMVCGAFGSTAAAMSVITDGSFGIQIDGETAIQVGSLDFSEIPSLGDTRASAVCGANGTNIAGWTAVTNGGFALTVNGTLITLVDIDFTGVTALGEVAAVINAELAGFDVECRYDNSADVYSFFTTTAGATSTITVLAAGTTTDISGAGYLNGTGATLTQGTGTDDTLLAMVDVINSNATLISTGARCEWNGTAFTFVSGTEGPYSAVSVLTAGAAGTDISGAGYLNGLTGTGTATAGAGGGGVDSPRGIYLGGSITAAELVAGDVVDRPILVGGCCTIDVEQLVLENSLTVTTEVVSKGDIIRGVLATQGIYLESTIDSDEFEN